MSLMNRHKRIPFAGNRRHYNQHNQGIRIIFGLREPQSLGHSFGTKSLSYSSSSSWPLNLAMTSC